jgi:hypothetical protein
MEERDMNRRDFLKLATVGSAAVVTTRFIRRFSFISPGVFMPGDLAVRLGGKLFKGTADGRILVSKDGGQAWHCAANFGEACQVRDIYAAGGRLYARIGCPGGVFGLVSVDGAVWRTAG